jgi:phosphoglucosamine mutase
MLQLSKRIHQAETKLGKDGRVVVRWSGTEAKLRLMLEGPDTALLNALVAEMSAAARQDLIGPS